MHEINIINNILFFIKKKQMRVLRKYNKIFFTYKLNKIFISNYLYYILFLLSVIFIILFSIFRLEYKEKLLKNFEKFLNISVQCVDIYGNYYVSDIDILKKLYLKDNTMIGLNIEKLRHDILKIPWLSSVYIKKVYPNKIKIFVVERTPLANWKNNGITYIIDCNGDIITNYNNNIKENFLLFIGKGAEKNAYSFLKEIKSFSYILQHAVEFIRIEDRRWNIKLDNGILIKLPEIDAYKKLQCMFYMEKKYGLFNRNIVKIDLRLNDRITVQLSRSSLFKINNIVFKNRA